MLGAEREAGSWEENAFQGHYHGSGKASYISSGSVYPEAIWDQVNGADVGAGASVALTNRPTITDLTHGTPRVAAKTRPDNISHPVIIYIGRPK